MSWIGWQLLTLNDLCDINWGNTNLTKSSYVDEGEFLAVSAAGCDGRIDRKEHSKNTPVLSAIGAQCGKMFLPQEDFTAIKNTMTLTPRENISDGRFIYHLLTSINLPQRGAGQPFITKGDVQKFLVKCPPLEEQKRIAAVLDKADEVRAKRRAALEKLDSLLQSVFLDMFGDPVSNPKGWNVKPLKQCAELLTGFAFKSNEYVKDSEQIRLCRGANILPNRIDWSDVAYWEKEKAKGLERYVLKENDIVIAMDRPWISSGFKIAQISETDLPSLLVQRVTRVRANNGLSNDYLFQILKHDAFVRHCKPTETTIPHISSLEISSFAVPIPEKSLIEKFSLVTKNLKSNFENQQNSRLLYDNLFQSLQQRAFAGELFGAKSVEANLLKTAVL